MKTARSLTFAPALALLALGLLLGPSAFADVPEELLWNFQSQTPQTVQPPNLGDAVVEFVLDDGTAEGTFGISIVPGTAQQFMWLNQFPSTEPSILTEIQVLFTPGPNVTVGDAVELVVYHDSDSDPTNGATFLTSFSDVVQALDGTTFSTYTLPSPQSLPGSGELLLGVINRFVSSGVSLPSDPAVLDTTTSESRSWVAVWSGDVPASPPLAPDLFIDRVDVFVPGNWMIRGTADAVPPVEVPTTSAVGALLLALLLGVAGWRIVGRR